MTEYRACQVLFLNHHCNSIARLIIRPAITLGDGRMIRCESIHKLLVNHLPPESALSAIDYTTGLVNGENA